MAGDPAIMSLLYPQQDGVQGSQTQPCWGLRAARGTAKTQPEVYASAQWVMHVLHCPADL